MGFSFFETKANDGQRASHPWHLPGQELASKELWTAALYSRGPIALGTKVLNTGNQLPFCWEKSYIGGWREICLPSGVALEAGARREVSCSASGAHAPTDADIDRGRRREHRSLHGQLSHAAKS